MSIWVVFGAISSSPPVPFLVLLLLLLLFIKPLGFSSTPGRIPQDSVFCLFSATFFALPPPFFLKSAGSEI